ncbi:growth-blocking peptide, long form-like [Aricia agestis]|uniref:growth-blocking peptide, long form-like n=1 Tax=Aricia agestis TaxID=91739 RepID=UPI001C2052E0|nr:growth-blocking peptide, long form-like [Aricia agestis]
MKYLCLVLCALLVCLAQTNGGLIPDNVLNGLLSAPTNVKNAVDNAITFKDPDEGDVRSYENPPQVPTTPVAVTEPPTTTKPPTTTVAPASKTATEKDGRENFAGGCSTGFKRTPDGRCMPTI